MAVKNRVGVSIQKVGKHTGKAIPVSTVYGVESKTVAVIQVVNITANTAVWEFLFAINGKTVLKTFTHGVLQMVIPMN